MKRNSFTSETIFDIPSIQDSIDKIESEIQESSFWENNPDQQGIFQTLNRLKRKRDSFLELDSQKEDLRIYLDFLKESPEDKSIIEEIQTRLSPYQSKIEALEIECHLSEPFDHLGCIFSLQSGAGGTDAQDWTQMLFRMYSRFIEQAGLSIDVVEYSPGDEAGIKSATMLVNGDFAYGQLRAEIGVHRMVRLSPFNSNNKRQTSFAAVDIIPQLNASHKQINIDTKDLKIDTFRASGAGGQHVNKTDSAVRITHIPTGIVAQSQSSRSQGANKETAMSILEARIIQRCEEEHTDTLEAIRGSVTEIAWGNQIRSYVFHPYQMVKDHRSNMETSNISAVMDDDIRAFITAYLWLL